MNNESLISVQLNSSYNTTDSIAYGGFTLLLYIVLPLKICLILLTTILNTFIVVVILFMIKRKTFSNFIFLSMAIADSIVGYSSLPFMTVFTTYGYWPLGYSGCVFWIINDWTSCTISLCNLLLISVHRYIHIRWPFKSSEKLTTKRMILLVFVWIICYSCWATSIILVTQNDFVPETCYFTYTFVYVAVSDFLTAFMFMFLILVFNILIFFELKKKKRVTVNQVHDKRVKASRKSDANSVSTKTSQTNYSVAQTTVTSKMRLRNDRNAFYCIICIVANLVLNWTIFLVCWPVSAYCPECVNPTLYEVSYWTVYLYSAINPIILFVFNESFRVEAKKITRLFNIFKKN